MPVRTFLIFHKDHPLYVRGVNSGAEMATLMLARFLARKGARVIVCGQLQEGETTVDGVSFWDLGPEFDIMGALIRARSLGGYHLISAGRSQPIMESRRETGCVSRLLISHDRSGNDTGINPKVLSKICDHIVCVSHAQREIFLRSEADPSRTTVVHNGVDLDVFAPGDPHQRDYQSLVFAGALVEDKGVHVLLQSFAELKARHPRLSLDIFGSASLWGRAPLFDERQIESQLPGVKFHGKVPQTQIAAAFARAGICVVPSIWFDPFPLTALEAQVTGCPVVAFDVGGLKEGLIHGETGIVLGDISQKALTNALNELLSQPELLKSMSRKALETARVKFTWNRVADTITELCDRAAGERAHAIQVAGQKVAEAERPARRTRLGFVTTWNQQCGLATYAGFLLGNFEKDSFLVLAEKTEKDLTAPDQSFVRRCWQRGASEFADLERIAVDEDLAVLHLNFHDHNFVPSPEFLAVMDRLRLKGIKLISHMHTTFTLDERCKAFLQRLDMIVVHSAESGLQVVANGASPDKVRVLPHGVVVRPQPTAEERLAIRKRLGIPALDKLIVSFGFVQRNKGMEGVIEAVSRLSQKGFPCWGVIAGTPNKSHPESVEYSSQLKSLAAWAGITDRVTFTDRFLSEDEVTAYLSVADLVLMNYQSQYYEASGACSLAVGAGAVVATSLAPAFVPFGDAVWHITAGFPAPLSAEVLLVDERLRSFIKQRAREYCEKYSWPKISELMKSYYRELGLEIVAVQPALSTPTRPALVLPTIAPEEVIQAPRAHVDYPAVMDFILAGPPSAEQNFFAVLERAEELSRRMEFEEAEKAFAEAERINSSSSRMWRSKAAMILARGDVHEGKRLFEKALSLNPDDPKTLCGIGMAELRLGQYESAYQNILAALKKAPDYLIAIRQLLECAYVLGRYEHLELYLEQYCAGHADDMEMLYCLAGCYFKREKFVEATTCLDRILLREPRHQNARQLLEIIEVRGKQHVEAPAAPDESGPIDRRIAALEDEKKRKNVAGVAEGVAQLKKERLTPPQLEKVEILEAEGLVLGGQLAEAEKIYDGILARNEKSVRALCGKGVLEAHFKRLEKAADFFRKAHDLESNYDVALAGLGLCAYLRNEHEQAWDFYTLALKSNPGNARALLGLLELGYPKKRYREIESSLKAYLEVNPADLNFLYSLAGCYYAQEKFEEALSAIDRILVYDASHKHALELQAIIGGRRPQQPPKMKVN